MPYQSKTNWKYDDVVTEHDLNRIEGGIVEAQEKVNSHASRTDNPHGVTPEQIGAETPTGVQAKVNAHANRTDNPHGVTCEQIGAIRVDPFDAFRDDYDAIQGLFCTVELRRADGKLYQKAVQSNPDTNGKYQRLMVKEYDETGEVVIKTKNLELIHDPNVKFPLWREV
ncbi:hypothetical protein [Tumebacillus lipolyticus]|uniref:Uncharacterized protein n=1 Tax=Tumebacillus lipolyticus TaxID=1280370 RepID=A0ABW5A0H7_9BACL